MHKKILNHDEYEWLGFAQSYAQMARLACLELLDDREKKHLKAIGENVKVGNWSYDPRDLFIPIVFNLKHSIEVFLKTASIQLFGKYDETTHNLDLLLKEVKIEWEKTLTKLKPIEIGGDKISQKDINNLPENLKILERLIMKYYHCELLSGSKSVISINDDKNDVFRYPENKARTKIDLSLVNKNTIERLLKDIEKMLHIFNSVGYIIAVHKES